MGSARFRAARRVRCIRPNSAPCRSVAVDLGRPASRTVALRCGAHRVFDQAAKLLSQRIRTPLEPPVRLDRRWIERVTGSRNGRDRSGAVVPLIVAYRACRRGRMARATMELHVAFPELVLHYPDPRILDFHPRGRTL